MKVTFANGEHRGGIATYTTDWHERGGVMRRRIVVVSRRFTYTPLLRREVVEYRIIHTERDEGGQVRTLLDAGVSTFRAALDALGRELERLIADGYAHKSDLERVPTVRRSARPRAGKMVAGQYPAI